MPSAPEPQTVTIDRVGARGDGIAETAAGRVFVPAALPGERWQRDAGTDGWHRIGDPAPARVTPPCPHFGACGGCVAQHMDAATYQAWKQRIAVDAFAHQGIDIAPPPLWQAPPASRRRVTLTAARRNGAFALGYHGLKSHRTVAIDTCLIADPHITNRLEELDALAGLVAARLASKDLRVSVTAASNGLDVVCDAVGRGLGPADRSELATRAASAGILRLTVGNDEIFQLAEPVITADGIAIPLPQGAFLQAVPEAERFMAARVVAGLGRARRVADLFSGLGTLTLPVARRARVTAYDNDEAALDALERATRHAQGLKPVTVRRRDLFREPLSRLELEAFDAVVLDPPRAGAEAQAKAIARSGLANVVMVSCNPATLARDVRTLREAGFGLHGLDLVDQFLFSPHLEAVAVLRRGG